MSRYKIIIFDLDGTLTDSEVGITKSIQYALSKFDIIEEDLKKLKLFIGPPLTKSFQKYYSLDETKAVKAVGFYREYFSEFGIYQNKVYPGIPDLLRELKNDNRKLVLATSKLTVFAEKVLKYFDLYDLFDLIIGSNSDGTRILKKEMVRDILLELQNFKKQNFMVVGDREDDIIAAKENGISSMAVTYGYGSIEELKKANPDYFAHSLKDIKRMISEDRDS
jgi:phosphoglycolate phosphatase